MISQASPFNAKNKNNKKLGCRKGKKQEHHKKYLITKGKEDYAQAIEDQGFHIVYNPPGDGSCQFAALSHQIRKLGIHRSPKTIRKEIVEYLERNPYDRDGFPLLEHLADNEFATWTDYIEYMAQDGTYGDQLTLYAAANLYNVEIRIASSLGEGGQHVFSPSTSNSIATVNLGHFAENEGEHYVSLEQAMTDNDNCENEIGESIPEDFSSDIAAGDTESNNIEGAEIDDAFNVDDRGKEGSSNHDTEIRNGGFNVKTVSPKSFTHFLAQDFYHVLCVIFCGCFVVHTLIGT